MGKKKHEFTKEEKEIIHRMKDQLSMMGVPREQWSGMIQEALKAEQKLKRLYKKKEKQGGIMGAVQKVRDKLEGGFQKVMTKKLNMESSMDDFFGDLDNATMEEGMEFMNNMLFGSLPDFKKITESGTFLEDRPNKKRMIVHFDENEE